MRLIVNDGYDSIGFCMDYGDRNGFVIVHYASPPRNTAVLAPLQSQLYGIPSIYKKKKIHELDCDRACTLC